MKAFELSTNQVAAVITALVVDVLGSKFRRHIDTLTVSTWTTDTKVGLSGVELSEEESKACLVRIYRFFGAPPPDIVLTGAETLGDWAVAVGEQAGRRLKTFAFSAAGENANVVDHRADAIYADAASAANLLYGRRRIISLVSPHSLIGFTLSILAANLLRAPSVDARGMAPGEFQKFLAFGDAVIATPSLWRYLIAQGVTAPDNSMAVFFGEPMTPEISAAIRKAGFGAQREIYGSTEHGLIGWRDSPSDPFALLENWRRNGDELNRTLPSGESVAASPMDVLLWEGERRFRLGGRRDGAVQIGAVNVFPTKIAEKIAEHPDVRACAVTLFKNDSGVDRLIANIELKTGGQPSETMARSIDAWCRSNLRPHERPRLYAYIAAGK